VVTKLWSVAETYTPKSRIADYTQAMMDLGATLCTRSSPDCPSCPISSQCIAYKNGNPQDYPGKKPKKVIPVRDTCFLMVTNQQGHWLLEQNPPVGLWGGLWVFPQCDSTEVIEDTLLRLGAKHQGCTILDRKRHTFSHFHLDYHAVHIILADDSHFENQVRESANQVWYNPQKPISLGLPAPIKALLDSVASK
jgi:A/G-specific adenine glycosylase